MQQKKNSRQIWAEWKFRRRREVGGGKRQAANTEDAHGPCMEAFCLARYGKSGDGGGEAGAAFNQSKWEEELLLARAHPPAPTSSIMQQPVQKLI